MFAEFEDDEDDYDAVEEETPAGAVAVAPGPASAPPVVVVPTVASADAVTAAAAMVVPPTVAVPSIGPAVVPTVATLTAAAATTAAKKATPKPRTAEERGKILRFTDLGFQAKQKRAPFKPPTKRPRRQTSVVGDDQIFAGDGEVDDDSGEESEEEAEAEDAIEDRRGTRGDLESSPSDSDDDDAPEPPDADPGDPSSRLAGDGHFTPHARHVPVEHLEWEDKIAWGDSDSDSDSRASDAAAEKEKGASRGTTKSSGEPAKDTRPPPVRPTEPNAAAPNPSPNPKPKKMVVRFGCKPAARPDEGPGSGAGGPGGGKSGSAAGPAAIGAIVAQADGASKDESAADTSEGNTEGPREGTREGTLAATTSARSWWGEDPDAPLDAESVPFASTHAQYTRLWGERVEKQTKNAPASSRANRTPRPAGSSEPSSLLRRRNVALTTGEWLEEVAWTPRAFARRARNPPPVWIDPNDPNLLLRSYDAAEGEDEEPSKDQQPPAGADQAATEGDSKPVSGDPLGDDRFDFDPMSAALATIMPGRALPLNMDVDATLNISLDGEDDEGGGRSRADREGGAGKKDKGLVGRPGRMESVFNAAVVGGPPAFAPDRHIKHPNFPKAPPLFAPPAYAHRHKVGLALALGGGKSNAGDDKFQVAVKSLATESPTVKIGVRPGDSVDALLRRVRKKWPDLRGKLEAYFPEGEQHKKHVLACQKAKAEGADQPRAPPLDPSATLEQCGVKRRVPEPLVYVVAPDWFLLDERVVSEQKPQSVVAAQAALARAMGEETADDKGEFGGDEKSRGKDPKQSAAELAATRAAVAAGDPAEAVANAMASREDLSATNGRIVLVQYAEDSPPLIARPGMGAKRVTYYRRRTQGDTSGRSLTQGGRRAVVDLRPEASSPFISDLPPGMPQEALETTLFRAPLFTRRIASDEGMFLLIRSPRGGFTCREVTEYFCVGQQEPHVEVFQPNTDRCRDFEERAINAAVIFSLLKQREEKVPERDMRVKVSDIERQFNRAISDKDIRRRIRRKVVLPVRPPGQRRRAGDYEDDDADEFELNPSYRFEDDLMIHRMCPVEEVVAYDSMRAAKARLEHGRDPEEAARIRKLAGTSMTQMQNAFQAALRGATPAQRKGLQDLELLLALQPWSQTTEFLAAVGGRAVLHLDASRRMREKTGKYYHYVRRQAPKDPDAAAQPKIKPGTVTGTDADLRKLTMPQTERILLGFGVELPHIKSLHRWKRIGLIRTLSGAATSDKNAEFSGLSRFARSLRVGIQQQMQEQRDAANKIFKHMRRGLQDKRGGRKGGLAGRGGGGAGGSDSSDDDSGDSGDSDDVDSDEDSDASSESDDSLADELEGAMDEDQTNRAPDEDEERRELAEMRRMMTDGEKGKAPEEGARGASSERHPGVPPGKRLVLKRIVTRQYPDGRVEKIEDDVSADVGEAWMRARRVGADGTIDLEKSREAVMQILYPHGVDPPAYVSGGSIGGGGLSLNAGTGQAQLESGTLARTIKAPNFQGTADQKAELLRLRKRKMEMLRRRKKKAAELRAQAGISEKDLAALEEKAKAEEEANKALEEGGGEGRPGADGQPPKKLKIALSFKPKLQTGGAGPSRFKPSGGGSTRGARAGASGSRGNQTPANPRDQILLDITEALAKDPNFASFIAPVTKKMLPDYGNFVSRKMDLGTVAKTLRAPGGYLGAEAWMADVRQILTNARLYHEADDEVMVRVPAVVELAANLVRDAEAAVEARAGDLRIADARFDLGALEATLGRAPGPEAAEAVERAANVILPGQQPTTRTEPNDANDANDANGGEVKMEGNDA